jgi:hypothetical protein
LIFLFKSLGLCLLDLNHDQTYVQKLKTKKRFARKLNLKFSKSLGINKTYAKVTLRSKLSDLRNGFLKCDLNAFLNAFKNAFINPF